MIPPPTSEDYLYDVPAVYKNLREIHAPVPATLVALAMIRRANFAEAEVARLRERTKELEQELSPWPKCHICKTRHPHHTFNCPDR